MSYHDECLDGPQGCQGEVFERQSFSGSGMAFPRCDKHYDEYAERQCKIQADISRRYPRQAPADFDPYYAGERWEEDY